MIEPVRTIPYLHYSEIWALDHLGSVLGALPGDDVFNQDGGRGEAVVTREKSGVPPSYHSYLLRVWRESEYGAWRASLEGVTTGERHGFPNLPSLLAFLQAECQALAAYHQEDLGEHRRSSHEKRR
jgi:hypothetical protein